MPLKKSDFSYRLVQLYLKPDKRPMPYPWHPTDVREGTSTLFYARMLLDALSGDDRRTDLRKVYRIFQNHQKEGDAWKDASYRMLAEICHDHCDVLPYDLIRKYLIGPEGGIYGLT